MQDIVTISAVCHLTSYERNGRMNGFVPAGGHVQESTWDQACIVTPTFLATTLDPKSKHSCEGPSW